MKPTEIIDMVIVFILTLAATSFFVVMVMKLDQSSITYLDDKTVYEYTETTESLAIKNRSTRELNPGQVYLLIAVQDNYCPFTGYVRNSYNTDKVNMKFAENAYWKSVRMDKYTDGWLKDEVLKDLTTGEIAMSYNHVGAMNSGEGYWEIYKR